MDPMCSWCWAFSKTLDNWLQQHPDLDVLWVMGGLAPDSDEPMPQSMREAIASTWQRIESQTGTRFNYDFWHNNTPRRSTYPSCRAVIAAGELHPQGRQLMSKAIQQAYYLEAKNPSDTNILIERAASIGLDEIQFAELLSSELIDSKLNSELELCKSLGVQGFPALLLVDNESITPLALGYSTLDKIEKRFQETH
ncbi:DSBA-like thioredoxin domain protein [Marinobacterium sp. xm-d-509]|nr:DSBA-like thioredoxin domain protein [Marinobacterium sp. xm-g-48]NRP82729.1 DSBA-like thioredoxin domain protein [Marinobacterium sp. xm-d-509]NRQ00205.1 DSBA-like thioredoxin domain protein [Marinobacterium sp. xm-v-233]